MRRHVVLIVGIWLVVIFIGLGLRGFWWPDEPRHAEVAREMYQEGSLLQPLLNGAPYPDKPPLFFWLAGLLPSLCGMFSAFTLRLASALAGLGCALTLYALGRRLYSARAGFTAALVLLTTFEFAWLCQRVDMNPWVAWLVLATVFLGVVGTQSRRRVPWLAAFLLLGFGLILKGPVVVMLALLVLLPWMVAAYGWRGLARCPWWGLVLMAVGPLVWIVPLCLQAGSGSLQELWNTVKEHALSRVSGAASHQQPMYYYLSRFPFIALPWIVFLPSAWRALFRKSSPVDRPWRWLPVIWIVAPFAVMSLFSSKRELYLLPLLPGVALAVGFYFSRPAESPAESRGGWFKVPGCLLAIGFGTVSVVVLVLYPQLLPAQAHGWPSIGVRALLLVLSFALGAVCVLVGMRRAAAQTVLWATASVIMVGFLIFRVWLAPALDPWISSKAVAEYLRYEAGGSEALLAVEYDPAAIALELGRTIPEFRKKDYKRPEAAAYWVIARFEGSGWTYPQLRRAGLRPTALFQLGRKKVVLARDLRLPRGQFHEPPAPPPWIGDKQVKRDLEEALRQVGWRRWLVAVALLLPLLIAAFAPRSGLSRADWDRAGGS